MDKEHNQPVLSGHMAASMLLLCLLPCFLSPGGLIEYRECVHFQLQGYTDAQFPMTSCVIIMNRIKGRWYTHREEQVPPTGHTTEECTQEPTFSNQTLLALLIVYSYECTYGWIHG